MKKYLVKKVADAGEDVTVNAKKFDGLLGKLLSAPPLPLEKLREEPGRLAARRPRKQTKGSR
jgi:hypothetical protein